MISNNVERLKIVYDKDLFSELKDYTDRDWFGGDVYETIHFCHALCRCQIPLKPYKVLEELENIIDDDYLMGMNWEIFKEIIESLITKLNTIIYNNIGDELIWFRIENIGEVITLKIDE